ncbi:MAG TPA: AraC family transcriptional regulator [Vicinamibacterales bacterium]|nr:AraC family transcriptional regulator [Vicinamibacterales bacterium]
MPQAFVDADNSVTTHPAINSDAIANELLPALLDTDRSVPDFIASAIALKRGGPQSANAVPHDRIVMPRQAGVVPDAAQATEPRTAQVIARLQAAGKDSGRIREATLAREFGIDPAHLGRLVRRATGLGFREWSLGIRMRLAVRALAKSDVSVKCVAHESGFTSTAQFDRGFRRLFGMTPGEFRRFVCGRTRRAS